MVKSKKSANNDKTNTTSTCISEQKSRSIVLDFALSPLVCRKLDFENNKPGKFGVNSPRKILSHKKDKNKLVFEIEWKKTADGIPKPSKAPLANVRKNCPELLIDYLLAMLIK